jgi:hypothetical protein
MQHAQSAERAQRENAQQLKTWTCLCIPLHILPTLSQPLEQKTRAAEYLLRLSHLAPRMNELILYIEAHLDSCRAAWRSPAE